ncbi:hypothetical protein ACFL27_25645 [candidate division CSSED10-310 bacterium]|uniref:Uncharacterized protein n=1 Tax=candidate division CSSED10-310 bacterium TaxID=2855610 RepID=A0ABV6Z561_UNCC1
MSKWVAPWLTFRSVVDKKDLIVRLATISRDHVELESHCGTNQDIHGPGIKFVIVAVSLYRFRGSGIPGLKEFAVCRVNPWYFGEPCFGYPI